MKAPYGMSNRGPYYLIIIGVIILVALILKYFGIKP